MPRARGPLFLSLSRTRAPQASPFITSNIKDPETELVKPARDGTLNVLESCARTASVRHVVVTSSVAAVYAPDKPEGYVFTEADWNTFSTLAGDGSHQYRYSKVAAERAAWAFVADRKPQFSLCTLCPPLVVSHRRGRRREGSAAARRRR